MAPFGIVQKIAVTLALLLVSVAVAGLLGWTYIQHRIALNARAPHLTLSAEPAVDFPFQTLDGRPKHLSDAKGKVIFVDLWETWCIQCVAEMPTVQTPYDRYRTDPNVTFFIHRLSLGLTRGDSWIRPPQSP